MDVAFKELTLIEFLTLQIGPEFDAFSMEFTIFEVAFIDDVTILFIESFAKAMFFAI